MPSLSRFLLERMSGRRDASTLQIGLTPEGEFRIE
jgi:hypothetical protein